MVQSVSAHYLQDSNLQRDAEVVSLSLTILASMWTRLQPTPGTNAGTIDNVTLQNSGSIFPDLGRDATFYLSDLPFFIPNVQIQPRHLMELLEEREKEETKVCSLCRLKVFTLELPLDIMIFTTLDGFLYIKS